MGLLMKEKGNSRKKIFKAIFLGIIIILNVEFGLFICEQNNILVEPYNWGNRNDIPFKINECNELFKNNPNKLKIIMVGDSRANQAFYPEQFDNYFNNETITYNLGFAGTAAIFQIFLLKHIYLPKLKPDIILWDITFNDFGNSTKHIEQNHNLFSLPMPRYYSDYKVNMTTNDYGDYYFTKFSRIYRYRSLFFPESFNIAKYENVYLNGFLKADGVYETNDTAIYNRTLNFSVHPEFLQDFLEMRQFFIDSNIPHLIINPSHNHVRWITPKVQEAFISYGDEYFLDLNGNETLMYDDLYYNKDHLNFEGAQIYTKFVNEKMASIINEQLIS